MSKITAILLICIMHIPAYAQGHNVTKASLLTTGELLAAEMGRTYQLAQNCDRDLDSIAAVRATTLFLNYFEEQEVKIVMKQYEDSVAQENRKSCNLGAIDVHALMRKIAHFMRMASRLPKNNTKQRKAK